MRIIKKFLRILAILLPCTFGVFFFSNNSYALQDLTYISTFNGTTFPSIGNFCNSSNNTPISCNGYSYLLVEYSNPRQPSDSTSVSFAYSGLNINIPDGTSSVLYHLSVSSSGRLGFYGQSSAYASVGDTITFTLLDHNPYSANVSGSLSITQNGTYDVSSYAEAVVDVPPIVEPGDYDDEFNNLITAIYICGASVIMLYFFYVIFGIFIKPTGGSK